MDIEFGPIMPWSDFEEAEIAVHVGEAIDDWGSADSVQ